MGLILILCVSGWLLYSLDKRIAVLIKKINNIIEILNNLTK